MEKIKESEKVLERKLCQEIKRLGGIALKIPASQFAGIPDRMCLLPGGVLYFVEMKSTGVKPTKIQLNVHNKLRALGFEVWVLDSTIDLKVFLSWITIY